MITYIPHILNILAITVLLYDTIGHIVNYSKKENNTKVTEDYNRLIYTWIFYLSVCLLCCTLCCSSCEGYFSGILYMIFSILKLYLALPITGGVKLFKSQFIDNSIISKLMHNLTTLVKGQLEKIESSDKTHSTKANENDAKERKEGENKTIEASNN